MSTDSTPLTTAPECSAPSARDWVMDSRAILFIAVLVVGIAARVFALVYFSPQSDVYYYDVGAVQALLQGASPYGHAYEGIPTRLATPGAENVFAYLPFTALYAVPFHVMGDIRIGAVLADSVIAVCLYRQSPTRWGLVASSLYLLVPFSLFLSIVYLNNVVFAMALVAVSVESERSGQGLLSGVTFGLALATSLLVWLIIPFYVVHKVARGDSKAILVAGVSAAVIIVPFLVADPGSFLYDTLLFQFQRQLEPLVTQGSLFEFSMNLSLDSAMVSLVGRPVPPYTRILLDLVLLVVILARGGRTHWELPAGAFAAVSVFILPSDLYFSYAELPYMMCLFWLAHRGRTSSSSTGRGETKTSHMVKECRADRLLSQQANWE